VPKGSECKFYVLKIEFSCFKSSILTLSTKILTEKLIEKRTSFPKIKMFTIKDFFLLKINKRFD